jgi:molybdopterin-guanine dinucleotide biosynthesis protein B
VPTGLDVLDLNNPDAVAGWLVAHGERFDYDPEVYLA